MKWLRANGHTDAKTASEVFANALRSRIPHAKGSLPYVVTRAVIVAFAAASLVKRAPLMRAVVQIHHLRTKAAALTRTLSEMDTIMAKGDYPAARPTFAESGNDVVAAIEAAAERVEKFLGVEAPTTTSAWKEFVGSAATAMLDAGMSLEDITMLFAQEGSAVRVRERLRKQTSRRGARKSNKSGRNRK